MLSFELSAQIRLKLQLPSDFSTGQAKQQRSLPECIGIKNISSRVTFANAYDTLQDYAMPPNCPQ